MAGTLLWGYLHKSKQEMPIIRREHEWKHRYINSNDDNISSKKHNQQKKGRQKKVQSLKLNREK
jgi:hypothetical protein